MRKVEVGGKKPTVLSLLKTQWNQHTPYNGKCPFVADEQCLTGCVALPATVFAWNKMLKTYNGNYTQEEADAVATLMLYCGCALSMDYVVDGSGADSTSVCDAMEYFFGMIKASSISIGDGDYCDGHFKLSVLYPYSDSYDDAEHEGGYASEQMAVINIVPKDFQGFDTSIGNMPLKQNEMSGYDLSGRRLPALGKGFNIVNSSDVRIKEVPAIHCLAAGKKQESRRHSYGDPSGVQFSEKRRILQNHLISHLYVGYLYVDKRLA